MVSMMKAIVMMKVNSYGFHGDDDGVHDEGNNVTMTRVSIMAVAKLVVVMVVVILLRRFECANEPFHSITR